MNTLKDDIKKYLLVRHTKSKLKEYNRRIEKSIPWIWRKGLMNNIETHCNVLLNSFFSEEHQNYRKNKFIIDSILKYNIEKSENLIKSNKKIKNMKQLMQLNSFIIFDEITKGFEQHKKKETINFSIKMQLLLAQEKLNSSFSVDDILNDKMSMTCD